MKDRLKELIDEYTDPLSARDIHKADFAEKFADHLLANGVIVPLCKVGDKVAVRASCECVSTISYYDECRSYCPFEDDCECDECDNTNERIFDTEISSIFCDSQGWKITFEHLSIIEARFTDMGTSFFVGENAHEQAIEYEKALVERSKE